MTAKKKKIPYDPQKFPGIYYFELDTIHKGRHDRSYYITYKDTRGKKIWEKVGETSEGMTASKASRIRGERTRDVRLGKDVKTIQRRRREALTVNDLMTKHFLPHAKKSVKPTSSARYIQLHKKWIAPTIGKTLLSNVKRRQVQKVIDAMTEAGKSPRTIQYALSTLRAAFNFAAKNPDIPFTGQNPTTLVKWPSIENSRDRVLTPDEASRLLAECKARSKQLFEICAVSLYAGLRAGEIFNLRWGDVNVLKGEIHVTNTKSKHDRTVFMNTPLKEIFEKKKVGKADSLVFPDRNGAPIKEISNAFDRAVNALGLNDHAKGRRERIVFHSLRHTCGSWLIAANANPFTVQTILGHRNIATTQRYVHVDKERQKAALDSLPTIVNGEQ